MKIEFEPLEANDTSHPFWGQPGYRGMDGGDVKITFENGNQYEFCLQDLMFYIVHRSYGGGYFGIKKKNN